MVAVNIKSYFALSLLPPSVLHEIAKSCDIDPQGKPHLTLACEVSAHARHVLGEKHLISREPLFVSIPDDTQLDWAAWNEEEARIREHFEKLENKVISNEAK